MTDQPVLSEDFYMRQQNHRLAAGSRIQFRMTPATSGYRQAGRSKRQIAYLFSTRFRGISSNQLEEGCSMLSITKMLLAPSSFLS
jgi:hypothetical protein